MANAKPERDHVFLGQTILRSAGPNLVAQGMDIPIVMSRDFSAGATFQPAAGTSRKTAAKLRIDARSLDVECMIGTMYTIVNWYSFLVVRAT